MTTTAIIAFREFFEAFLIIGVFLGMSRKLHLHKETEIWLAALLGIFLSIVLAAFVYIFGDRARLILSESKADLLESYLLIFSGFFLTYIIFSLHNMVRKGRSTMLIKAHQKLQNNVFDVSLFFTIVFLVLREGFEIALFTASVSLFSAFIQNMIGLGIGFVFALTCGIATLFAYVRFPVGKVFKATEYIIVLLGASFTQHGFTYLIDTYLHINLSSIMSLPFQFLPGDNTFLGHVLQSFVGIDQQFSLARLGIMLLYIGIIYWIFMRERKVHS